MRIKGVATCGICGRVARPTPVHAAFPGKPRRIAYSFVHINEGEDSAGLQSHGPRKRDLAHHRLTDDPGDSSPLLSSIIDVI